MKNFLLGFIFLFSSVNALEFGYMGNTSFGMGGSGVALVDSPFSMFYNPALQSVDSSLRLGYSLGTRFKENKISDLSKISLSSINNIDSINNILKNNAFKVASENGVALQIPLSFGNAFSSSIGFGLFYTKRGVVNFTGHLNTGTTDIDSAVNANIITNRLDIVEIPVSYAMQLFSGFGSLNLGISAKYIYTDHNFISTKFTKDTIILDRIKDIFSNSKGATTNTFGVDVGLAYALPLDVFVIGVVGKNLNSPSVNTQGVDKLKLDAQYRLGIATTIIPLTSITLDFDLKPNVEFSGLNTGIAHNKVQYISVGGMVSLGFFDIKIGAAKNILRGGEEGLLVSGGLGFSIIDLSIFSNTNFVKINNAKLPSEFGIKISGGFSF